jgi:hypothetical protein
MLNFPNTTSRPCIDESRILLTITGKNSKVPFTFHGAKENMSFFLHYRLG